MAILLSVSLHSLGGSDRVPDWAVTMLYLGIFDVRDNLFHYLRALLWLHQNWKVEKNWALKEKEKNMELQYTFSKLLLVRGKFVFLFLTLTMVNGNQFSHNHVLQICFSSFLLMMAIWFIFMCSQRLAQLY